ncbi:MAG: alpha/beta hydrolase [Chitinophagaceae bacterium]|jgi:predicted alpha/beta superfamily hydrolase
MKHLFLFAALLYLLTSQVQVIAQLPLPNNGRIVRHENFQSKYVSARHVDVWLPANYTSSNKYAVLYMQDGQMLFDSSITWNKQEWGVDETLSRLMQNNQIRDCIVVGIWNGGQRRHAEYFPQKPFEALSQPEQDLVYNAYRSGGQSIFAGISISSDLYLQFLTEELKPFIDQTYSTLPDRSNTFVAGSSMGGLISLYALCEYPKVFGGAACLSTHWPGLFSLENNPVPAVFFSYLKKYLPSPKHHRIYFDHGTETLDSMYASLQLQVDEILREKRYKSSQWISRSWPGQDHSERSWRSRLEVPVVFLLKK